MRDKGGENRGKAREDYEGAPPPTREDIERKRREEAERKERYKKEREEYNKRTRFTVVQKTLELYKSNQLTLPYLNEKMGRYEMPVSECVQDCARLKEVEGEAFDVLSCIAVSHESGKYRGFYSVTANRDDNASLVATEWLCRQPQVNQLTISNLNSDELFLKILSTENREKVIFEDLSVSAQAFSDYLRSPLATTMKLHKQKISADYVKVFMEVPVNQLASLSLEKCKFEDDATRKAFVDAILLYPNLRELVIKDCGLSSEEQFQIQEKVNSIQWNTRLDKIALEQDLAKKYELFQEFERFIENAPPRNFVHDREMEGWVIVESHASSPLMAACVERYEKMSTDFSLQPLKQAVYEKVRNILTGSEKLTPVQTAFLDILERMMKDPMAEIRHLIQEIQRFNNDVTTQVRFFKSFKEYLPDDKFKQLERVCVEARPFIRNPIPAAPAKEEITAGAEFGSKERVVGALERAEKEFQKSPAPVESHVADAAQPVSSMQPAASTPPLSAEKVESTDELELPSVPLALPSVPRGKPVEKSAVSPKESEQGQQQAGGGMAVMRRGTGK